MVLLLFFLELRSHLLLALCHDLVVFSHVHVDLGQEVRIKLELKLFIFLLRRLLGLSWLLSERSFCLRWSLILALEILKQLLFEPHWVLYSLLTLDVLHELGISLDTFPYV